MEKKKKGAGALGADLRRVGPVFFRFVFAMSEQEFVDAARGGDLARVRAAAHSAQRDPPGLHLDNGPLRRPDRGC